MHLQETSSTLTAPPPSHRPGGLLHRPEGGGHRHEANRWDGSKIEIQSAPPLARGTYRREVASSVDALRRIIEQLSTSEVVTWGVPAHASGEFITKADLASLNGKAPASTIARTRDAFSFAPTMGWLMLDFDYVTGDGDAGLAAGDADRGRSRPGRPADVGDVQRLGERRP